MEFGHTPGTVHVHAVDLVHSEWEELNMCNWKLMEYIEKG